MQLVYVLGRDLDLWRHLGSYFEQSGYALCVFTSEPIMVGAAEKNCPSLILVDAGPNKQDGLETCTRVRRRPVLRKAPLLMLAEGATEEMRIAALESGADGFMPKPFSNRELLARVQAILRCTGRAAARSNPFSAQVLELADLTIDSLSMTLSVRGTAVETTVLEFRLMQFLAQHQDRVFTRDELLDAVWGETRFVTPRSVDACVQRIRKKIEPNRANPTYLKAVRGVGYRLDSTRAGTRLEPVSSAGNKVSTLIG